MNREKWDSRVAFLFAAIGSAVGLGNIWRFPYICYQNGGGAFLIPYLVALFTAGIPFMILEYGLGHMMIGSSPLSFSKINKRWEWVGWFALLVGFFVVVYYAVVMSWCFAYLFYSFNLSWGTDTQTFFFKKFLQISPHLSQIGNARLPIIYGLVLVWGLIFLCIFKGPKSVGKVVMITVPLPLILIAILVIRGLTLPGALKGISFYLTPNFKALSNPDVWLAAYSQIFFSLSLGFGILIAYASYLPKKADIVNNAYITSLANCGTSFFAGFAVFSTLGYLSFINNVPVEEVVKSGPGLAFVVFPEVLSKLPFAPSLFAVVFFILLLTLGIDSAFSLVEAVVAGKMDKWRFSRKQGNALVCGFAFVLGIIFTTNAGLYWLDIVDHFLTNFGLVAIGLIQCIVVGYFFGAERLREYINIDSDFKVGRWWNIFIKIITPGILIILLIQKLIERFRVSYEGYPQWALFLGGWLILILITIISIILSIIKRKD
jgi:NSS family neurotransmitter:Na+ symporter